MSPTKANLSRTLNYKKRKNENKFEQVTEI